MDLLGAPPAWWMGLLAIANLVALVGAIALAWMNLRMRADFVTRRDYLGDQQKGAADLGQVTHRVGAIELKLAAIPKSDAFHELSIGMEKLQGELKVTNQRLNGIDDIVSIFRRQIELMDEFLREQGRRM